MFSGITMVFMPAVTTFAISDILSGRKIQLMGNVIESQFLRNYNWHYGSAISLILIVIILFSVIFSSKYEKKTRGRTSVKKIAKNIYLFLIFLFMYAPSRL